MVEIDAGLDVRFADLPQIEGTAGRFMLKQMALVAELEAVSFRRAIDADRGC